MAEVQTSKKLKSTRAFQKCAFSGKVWRYKGSAGWHFVTLPNALSKKIRRFHGESEEGWGRLKVTALVNGIRWPTAIWFDTKLDRYLLPIKASVRAQAGIKADSGITIELKFMADGNVELFKRV